jgi:hypothetical protein
MHENQPPSANILEYFRALRTEIIEAQKLRVQVGLAKTVFLGTLLGFFFKDDKGDPIILICPIVALMFDCMIYGLSFNIRDIGSYICEYLEPKLGIEKAWQGLRRERVLKREFTDWGRIIFGLGNYGLSISVAVISFIEAKPKTGMPHLTITWLVLVALIMALAVAWGLLIWERASTGWMKPKKHPSENRSRERG